MQLIGHAELVDQRIDEAREGLSGGFIRRAVLIEPGPVVVLAQIAQETEDRGQIDGGLHGCFAF